MRAQTKAEEYLKTGFAKGKISDHNGAIQNYSKAIEINPHFAKAYYLRGNAKVELSNYNGAIEDYNNAIEIDS
ncbi:MAG: tetratricopeptide repeat protein, partial [Ignavibacteriaceae bacterium]